MILNKVIEMRLPTRYTTNKKNALGTYFENASTASSIFPHLSVSTIYL